MKTFTGNKTKRFRRRTYNGDNKTKISLRDIEKSITGYKQHQSLSTRRNLSKVMRKEIKITIDKVVPIIRIGKKVRMDRHISEISLIYKNA